MGRYAFVMLLLGFAWPSLAMAEASLRPADLAPVFLAWNAWRLEERALSQAPGAVDSRLDENHIAWCVDMRPGSRRGDGLVPGQCPGFNTVALDGLPPGKSGVLFMMAPGKSARPGELAPLLPTAQYRCAASVTYR